MSDSLESPLALNAAGPAISVVVPLWNESQNVAPLTQRIFDALHAEARSIEVILVDDASTDDTWQQILQARRGNQRVRPIRHLQHSGQSAALWTGLRASRGGVIATLDGDLQNDPADLPRMLVELAQWDMVCGLRTHRADNSLRRLSAAIARRARRMVLHSEFRDTGCNLRVFKRSLLTNLLVFDGFHRFLPILAQDVGARVLEIPVAHHPRTAGRSKYGIWNRLGRGVCDLAMLAWYRKRRLAKVPTVEQGEPAAKSESKAWKG